jgi:hypothetical protein
MSLESMIDVLRHSLIGIGLVTLLELAVIARILLRPHRDPASRIAWVVVVGVLPLIGTLAYLLLGEVSIGRRRVQRLHTVLGRMPPFPGHLAEHALAFAITSPGVTGTSFSWAARPAVSARRQQHGATDGDTTP